MGTRTYAYDTFGNLTSLGGTAIAVDHGNNHLLGGAVYDGRGNMTDQPMGTWTRRLRWDEENRLLAVWPEGAGVPPDTWAFAYDHTGERVLKYRIDAGAVAEAELYLRDEAGNVLTELDWMDTGAGGYWARAKDHVYLGRDVIGSLDYTDGDPHIVTYARDHLGTQRAEVWGLDTATTTDLWPYGGIADTTAIGDAPPLANGAHLFTGHERDFVGTEADPLEGLDYMHARYYFHDLGRFLSVDPVGGSVGLSQSWNRYGYVGASPTTSLDTDGRLEIRATDSGNGGYSYGIHFDWWLERTNRAALRLRSGALKVLTRVWPGLKSLPWAIKIGKLVDKQFRGSPVTVYPDESGIPAVSGFFHGSSFEKRLMKEFRRYLGTKESYGPRSEKALALSVEAVIGSMEKEGTLTAEEAEKLRELMTFMSSLRGPEPVLSPTCGTSSRISTIE